MDTFKLPAVAVMWFHALDGSIMRTTDFVAIIPPVPKLELERRFFFLGALNEQAGEQTRWPGASHTGESRSLMKDRFGPKAKPSKRWASTA
ncbi:hypothetical protein SBP18_20870 [Rhodoferax ferrireducens]|uniref:hypothetical protein n=1 Tax=Rhodoferax ferrireducens TaxID=192843 RepID=UPI00298DAE1A|nr:hypothetical protein [Rhodoferax ferrireducens]WPC66891.1 hypothetical protein SBP18_20870 [Rhodoferax ferrireducens]